MLDTADKLVKAVPTDRKKIKEIKARIAAEKKKRAQIKAEAHKEMKAYEKAKTKALRAKLAKKGLSIAERMAAIDVALNESYAVDQVFDEDLYKVGLVSQ